ESIEAGNFPEYELGLQLIPEEDEFKFDFDLLDPTKLIPEALVPVQLVGKMVLNRNPDNFFAENEQAAFHPGHIVPGIDFSNDPLLQGRLFSYTDTQISRLGGPNFHEIPINRPVCPYHNLQRDGMHRMDIDTNPANYEPNSINDNWPRETPPGPKGGGFESRHERIDAETIRQRSPSFGEYYAHPRLFWLSQTPVEQQHIIGAFSFELGKVARAYIRERVVDQLTRIDQQLAQGVAENLGITLSDEQRNVAPPAPVNGLKKDPTLSLYAIPGGSLKGRVVGVLLNDKPAATEILTLLKALKDKGVHAKLLYSRMGTVEADDGTALPVSATFAGAPSLTVDAVIVPGHGAASLKDSGDARYYLLEAYKHLKPILLAGDARAFKADLGVGDAGEEGLVEDKLVTADAMDALLDLLAAHRVWSREPKVAAIPA
ncbi:catalase, partial [uncultured Pluralibacter sp.]|uniref:catalase n=1 Tax=uncultured Pluralibacter sp. TaxID=1490864 RepID=UPI002619E563